MPDSNSPPITRRALVAGAAGAIGGVVFGEAAQASQASQGAAPSAPVPDDPTAVPGLASGPLGARSQFENLALAPSGVIAGASFTPLHLLS